MLGVNLGRIGFLAEAEAEAIDRCSSMWSRATTASKNRMTLDVSVRVNGEVVDRGWAINEASLEKGPRLGVLGVVLEVDGRPVSTFGCDGVLVSTPTGSTAYAFSAGGPILWPDLEAMLVVPNNAHALFARPMVTSPKASIAIEIDADGNDALVFCDGRREMLVPAEMRSRARSRYSGKFGNSRLPALPGRGQGSRRRCRCLPSAAGISCRRSSSLLLSRWAAQTGRN